MAYRCCTIGILLNLDDCSEIEINVEDKVLAQHFSPNELYTMTARSECHFNQFTAESTICVHHENVYIKNKVFDKHYNKCCNPFALHELERLVKGLFFQSS